MSDLFLFVCALFIAQSQFAFADGGFFGAPDYSSDRALTEVPSIHVTFPQGQMPDQLITVDPQAVKIVHFAGWDGEGWKIRVKGKISAQEGPVLCKDTKIPVRWDEKEKSGSFELEVQAEGSKTPIEIMSVSVLGEVRKLHLLVELSGEWPPPGDAERVRHWFLRTSAGVEYFSGTEFGAYGATTTPDFVLPTGRIEASTWAARSPRLMAIELGLAAEVQHTLNAATPASTTVGLPTSITFPAAYWSVAFNGGVRNLITFGNQWRLSALLFAERQGFGVAGYSQQTVFSEPVPLFGSLSVWSVWVGASVRAESFLLGRQTESVLSFGRSVLASADNPVAGTTFTLGGYLVRGRFRIDLFKRFFAAAQGEYVTFTGGESVSRTSGRLEFGWRWI